MLIKIEHDSLSKLTETEKNVISFINSNPQKISNMSISDVAEATYSSPATVSRAIKKCGISGFAELRYMLTQHTEGSKQDTTDINAIFNKSLTEISNTIDQLSIDTILKAVEEIKNAERIFIFSKGLSNLAASEFTLKLQLLGKAVVLNTDSNIMQELSKQANSKSVVIIFSMSGSTPELISVAERASSMGAHIIAITCAPSEVPLNKLAHIQIQGYSHRKRSFARIDVTSRLSLYVISRILSDYLMIQSQQEAAKEKNLSNRSYHI